MPFGWTNTPNWLLICWCVSVANAVLFMEREPVRLNDGHSERMEYGAPLCQVKIEPVCQPSVNKPSILFRDPNSLCPLPIGSSYVKLALNACVRSNGARSFSSCGRALSCTG